MQILLDTHALIWFVNGEKYLPDSVGKVIPDINNKCFVSVGSLWEIAVKLSLEKLELKSDFKTLAKLLADNEIEILPISFEHIQKLLVLPFHHRDPFDRLIIAQGLVEKFTIITKDSNFAAYKVKVLWSRLN